MGIVCSMPSSTAICFVSARSRHAVRLLRSAGAWPAPPVGLDLAPDLQVDLAALRPLQLSRRLLIDPAQVDHGPPPRRTACSRSRRARSQRAAARPRIAGCFSSRSAATRCRVAATACRPSSTISRSNGSSAVASSARWSTAARIVARSAANALRFTASWTTPIRPKPSLCSSRVRTRWRLHGVWCGTRGAGPWSGAMPSQCLPSEVHLAILSHIAGASRASCDGTAAVQPHHRRGCCRGRGCAAGRSIMQRSIAVTQAARKRMATAFLPSRSSAADRAISARCVHRIELLRSRST